MTKEADMTKDNEPVVRAGSPSAWMASAPRKLYQLAEIRDIPGCVACFTEDGIFTDESIGVTYRGPKELARPIEIYAEAFPDMHRELYDVYLTGDVIVLELALQGTHNGPLEMPWESFPRQARGWMPRAAMYFA